jgi:hypothetical protein
MFAPLAECAAEQHGAKQNEVPRARASSNHRNLAFPPYITEFDVWLFFLIQLSLCVGMAPGRLWVGVPRPGAWRPSDFPPRLLCGPHAPCNVRGPAGGVPGVLGF